MLGYPYLGTLRLPTQKQFLHGMIIILFPIFFAFFRNTYIHNKRNCLSRSVNIVKSLDLRLSKRKGSAVHYGQLIDLVKHTAS